MSSLTDIFDSIKGYQAHNPPKLVSVADDKDTKKRKDQSEDDQDDTTDSAAAANWQAYFNAHPNEASGHRTNVPLFSTDGASGAVNISHLLLGKSGDNALDRFGIKDPAARRNVKAFLDTLAYSEGTIGLGNNGYNVKVGGGTFSGTDFPEGTVNLGHGLVSSASGRYQILGSTWKQYKNELGLTDFSAANQDAVVLQILKEKGALAKIEAGDTRGAMNDVRKVWASLPGAGYGQHENSANRLLAFNEQAKAKIDADNGVKSDVKFASNETPAAPKGPPKHANHGDLDTSTVAAATGNKKTQTASVTPHDSPAA